MRLKADVNYTNIFLVDKTKILVSRTLKEFEAALAAYGFCRVHKSDIINLKYIKSYCKGDGGSVTMDDGTEIDVSRSYKDAFMASVGN